MVSVFGLLGDIFRNNTPFELITGTIGSILLLPITIPVYTCEFLTRYYHKQKEQTFKSQGGVHIIVYSNYKTIKFDAHKTDTISDIIQKIRELTDTCGQIHLCYSIGDKFSLQQSRTLESYKNESIHEFQCHFK